MEYSKQWYQKRVENQTQALADIEALKKRIAETENEPRAQYEARKVREAADAEIKFKTKIQLQLDEEDGPLDSGVAPIDSQEKSQG